MEQALQEIIAINPPFFEEPIKQIKHLYETKHWFQLGLNVIDLLNQPGIIGEKIEFYKKFITYFIGSLDPLHQVQIIHLVSQDFSSPKAAIDFIEESLKAFKESSDAKSWLELQVVAQYIINGDFETAFNLLCKVEKNVTEFSPMMVRTLLYRVQASLDKARNDNDSFYEHGLLYLSTIKKYDDVVLAYDLCSAALISRNVCSFGELASHPIIQILKDSENKWIYDLIILLDNGTPEIYEEFNKKFLPIIESKPQFVDYTDTIKFKVTLSILLELIFSKPFESRIFTFDEIYRVCQIPKNQVEIVVLKALSAQIIKGFIDEVDERIVVTWCKPKALGVVRLQHLKDQIDRWIQKVHDQKVLLEIQSQAVTS
ncbi:26S proteasome non-ATPase regulatory subunit 13 [Tritrichomonas musculus]|uniref:26S proteasome non-ATPase regulatory subunit 13 n=1 Tax=Tritrichomonas musculus TaxID=1915356 RepID=A0ABR2K4W1_9EUKA